VWYTVSTWHSWNSLQILLSVSKWWLLLVSFRIVFLSKGLDSKYSFWKSPFILKMKLLIWPLIIELKVVADSYFLESFSRYKSFSGSSLCQSMFLRNFWNGLSRKVWLLQWSFMQSSWWRMSMFAWVYRSEGK